MTFDTSCQTGILFESLEIARLHGGMKVLFVINTTISNMNQILKRNNRIARTLYHCAPFAASARYFTRLGVFVDFRCTYSVLMAPK